MSRYCLDTSAYSRLRRGNERIAHLLDAAIWVGVPTVTLGELRFGFLGGAHRTRNETELSDFLGAPPVEVVPVDDAVARCYAEIVADLKRGGTPIPTNDAWIAACAAHTGSTVLTIDGHFERIARIGTLLVT
ncbi:MAG: type II toxin-antitoxin system VapC family toxin [Gemmatimonadales bacterium]|nr:type II toxin-antitoxin system VapC family toxin [Gemmatimonadales bacterium]MYG49501.1 type II toxin-antitoxin system VapC family toxin [Gemmatimonadales bacterium]MYK02629.1 type II toxin-antitoxin system VapC family toxin [Candidatus Palauibacter ramosifaciens]